MSARKILIDTSVWIEYFRQSSSPVSEKVDRILDEDEVYIPKIVMAELVQGARTEKEIAVVKDFIEAFHVIDQSENTWLKAGKLSNDLKKRGKKIHLLDCYIAVMAQEYGCIIFTLNRHFQDIKKVIGISLVE